MDDLVKGFCRWLPDLLLAEIELERGHRVGIEPHTDLGIRTGIVVSAARVIHILGDAPGSETDVDSLGLSRGQNVADVIDLDVPVSVAGSHDCRARNDVIIGQASVFGLQLDQTDPVFGVGRDFDGRTHTLGAEQDADGGLSQILVLERVFDRDLGVEQIVGAYAGGRRSIKERGSGALGDRV